MLFVMPHYIITEELKDLAATAIESLSKDVNVISVDDGSPMDTKFLDELSHKVIRLKENSGFAKACNAGLKWAMEQNEDYIGCANNDIEVFPGWLEALVEPHEKWDNVGITGMVASKDRETAKNHKGRKITEGGLLDDKMQSGGLWLMTKKSLKKCAFPDGTIFDEQFIIGGEEDVDLFLRLRDKHGMHIIMSEKAMFWHKEGATRWNEEIPGYKERNKALEQDNYDRFAEKWGFDIRTNGLNFYEYVLED